MRAPYPVVDIQGVLAPKTPPESRSGAVAGSIVTLSFSTGAVAERLNAPDSKSGSASGSTGVRIPPAPLSSKVYETASLIRRRFAHFGASYLVQRVSVSSCSDHISQYLPESTHSGTRIGFLNLWRAGFLSNQADSRETECHLFVQTPVFWLNPRI